MYILGAYVHIYVQDIKFISVKRTNVKLEITGTDTLLYLSQYVIT